MRKISILVLLIGLLCQPLLAQDLVEEGDRLARWGAIKEAEASYRKAQQTATGERLKLILFRRLALAEALQNRAGAEAIIEALESSPLDKDARLRILVTRGTLSFYAREYVAAERSFREVEELTKELNGPHASLARFAALSFLYRKKVAETGWPTDEELAREASRICKPLENIPRKELLEPLALVRANNWYKIWVEAYLRKLLKSPEDQEEKLKKLSAFVHLLDAAMLGRFLELKDPEAGSLVIVYPLLMAEGLAESHPAQAAQWISGVTKVLSLGQALADKAQPGQNVRPTGLAYFRARTAEVKGKIQLTQGQKVRALKNYAAAARILKEAELEIPLLSVLLENVAIRLKGTVPAQPEKLEAALDEARRLALKLSRPLEVLVADLLRAKLVQKTGSADEAVKLYEDVVARLEREAPFLSLRSLDFDIIAAAYDPLIRLLSQSGRVEEALQYQQRRVAMNTLSKNSLAKMKSQDPKTQAALTKAATSQKEDQELQAQLEAAQVLNKSDEIANIESKISNNRAEFLQALNDIGKADPDYADAVAIRPTSFARIQSKLPQGALLLQYSLTDTETLIFTATRDNLSIEKVPITRSELAQKIRESRKAITRLSAELESLAELYQLLIAPVESKVMQAEVVILAPTEELYLVPFAALIRTPGAQPEYLVDLKPLATVPGTESILTKAQSSLKEEEGIVIVGDPDGTLPAARIEASEIGSLFRDSKTYIAEQARPELIRQLSPDIKLLHLATHAVINAEDVNSSYLVMAGGEKEGRLTLGEVYGLDLDGLSLVTLSACQTALGQEQPTWTVASLAQAFNLAGAESLIASLWSVSDDSTRKLMVAFYTHIKRGVTKADSLRQAQQEVKSLSQYSHPFYWSGFTVIGDWQ